MPGYYGPGDNLGDPGPGNFASFLGGFAGGLTRAPQKKKAAPVTASADAEKEAARKKKAPAAAAAAAGKTPPASTRPQADFSSYLQQVPYVPGFRQQGYKVGY